MSIIQIQSDADFAGLRKEMRQYPAKVVEKATLRTLNRLGTRVKGVAAKNISAYFRVPQKNIRSKLVLIKANKAQQRVILTYSRSKTSRNKGGIKVTAGSLYEHLSDPAFRKRIATAPLVMQRGQTAFPQAPKGFRLAFRRICKTRYPIEVVRLDLIKPFKSADATLRAKVSSDFPTEWRRNAAYYKSRLPKKHTF